MNCPQCRKEADPSIPLRRRDGSLLAGWLCWFCRIWFSSPAPTDDYEEPL